MGENKSGKLHDNEARPVLGDITNQVGKKRGVSLMSGNKRIDEDSDSDSHFWKQVSLVVEKLEKERCGTPKCPKVVNEVGLSPLKGGKTYRLQTGSGDVDSVGGSGRHALQNVAHEIKEPSASALDSIDLDEDQDARDVVNVCEAVVAEGSKCCKESCDEVGKECQGEEMRALSDVGESDCSREALAAQVVSGTVKSVGVEGMTYSKSESGVTSRLTESQETRSFGLERCTLLKGDGSSSYAAGVDLLKNCSCSFCTKASYIWSDLHYQDAKGRISILEKSQKEASDLAQRYSVENQGNFSKATKLETDLMSQWKSLFIQMETIFASESSQLQANFLALKGIREDFKVNLEMINGMPTDLQQCSSDASDHTIT